MLYNFNLHLPGISDKILWVQLGNTLLIHSHTFHWRIFVQLLRTWPSEVCGIPSKVNPEYIIVLWEPTMLRNSIWVCHGMVWHGMAWYCCLFIPQRVLSPYSPVYYGKWAFFPCENIFFVVPRHYFAWPLPKRRGSRIYTHIMYVYINIVCLRVCLNNQYNPGKLDYENKETWILPSEAELCNIREYRDYRITNSIV